MTREGTEEAWLPVHERLRTEAARDAESRLGVESLRSWRLAYGQLSEARTRAENAAKNALKAERARSARLAEIAARDLRAERAERDTQQASRAESYSSGLVRGGGSPVLWGWVQYTGWEQYVGHVEAANYDQAIDALPLEVLVLPLEVIALLRARDPASWSVESVVPYGLPVGVDGATGADTLFMPTNAVYGVDPVTGLYFFDENGLGDGQRVRVMLDTSDRPYLLT